MPQNLHIPGAFVLDHEARVRRRARPVARPNHKKINIAEEYQRNFGGVFLPSSAFVLEENSPPIPEDVYAIDIIKAMAPDMFMCTVSQLKLNKKHAGIDIIKNITHIKESYPEFGMLNYGKAVIYVSRVSKRQWKRGYTRSIAKVTSPIRDEMYTEKIPLPSAEEREVIRNLFSTAYIPVVRSFERVSNMEVMGSCFTSNFAFVLKKGASKVMLAYKNSIVGYVNDDNMMVTLPKLVSHLKEELNQYVGVQLK